VKALVTGAEGYIGRILCKILKDEGWQVFGLDLKEPVHWELDETDFHHYYVGHYGNPRPYIQHKYDVIFHLGANSLLGPSVKNPLDYFDNNVSGMIDMLKNIKNEQPDTPIIFASSAATYGDPNKNIALKEEDAGYPINPYGWSKWFGERILEESCNAYGMRAYSMRFFNVTGGFDGMGQDLDQPHILTKMCQASINNETFYINGNDYATGDGTCVRDYVHVYDVCQALIAAAKEIQTDAPTSYTEYNVGSGVGYSNLDIARFVRMYYGLVFDYAPKRPGDPGYLFCDPTAIRTELKWEPTVDIFGIITSHYEHVKAKMNEY